MLHAEYADVPYLGPPLGYNSTSYGKRYIALHNTSNDATARGEASWATRRPDKTSSHYYQDVREVVQSLNTAYGANHAGSSMGNRYGIAYEFTGINDWTRQQWLERVNWLAAARQMARDCAKHSIPVRLLTVAQMQAGNVPGFVTHDLMRLAWGGTDHTDPGPGFPVDHLLGLVQQQLSGGTAPNIEEYQMFLSSDPITGKIYASDGWLKDRWEVAPNDKDRAITGDLPFLHLAGVIKLWDSVPRAEVRNYSVALGGTAVKFAVWRSTGDGFGKLRTTSPIDVPALVAALAPGLRTVIETTLAAGSVPNITQIEAAMIHALNGTKLSR